MRQKHYHELTTYTQEKLDLDKSFIDWKSQPSSAKTYPDFYPKITFDELNEVDDDYRQYFLLLSGINSKVTIGNSLYDLRVIPSAGGLYPTELYMQIKGLKGVLDGIYHYEVKNSKLTLLYEIIGLEGIEAYLNIEGEIEGIIFLISANYYRSSWKYSDIALRYCLIEAGHQLGAIECANLVHDKNNEFVFEFDKEKLNYMFGFEDKEFFIAASICGKNNIESMPDVLDFKLPFVMGTNYYIENKNIINAYSETLISEKNSHNSLSIKEFKKPKFGYNIEILKYTIWSRRSNRFFTMKQISRKNYLYIYEKATEAIPSYTLENINIFSIVNSVKRVDSGIYKNLELVKPFSNMEEIKKIFLGQNIVLNSSVVFVLTGKWCNYQTLATQIGLIGHRICIASRYINIGSTPIGSFFDEDMKKLLSTDDEIFYTIVIGK